MSVKVKSLYRVSELAEMSGLPRRTLARWLDRQGVTLRQGRSVVVPLVGFRDAFPQVWESIRIRLALKPGQCDACGAQVLP